MKLKIRILILSLILGLGACDVVTLTPESDIVDANFWKTQGDAQAGLTGVYQSLQSIVASGYFSDFVDFRSDDIVVPEEYGWPVSNDIQIRQNQISSSDLFLNLWTNYYLAIGRANNVIKNVSGMALSNTVEKNRILGEAYFLRALLYFHLVRDWGDSPIITEPISKIDESVFVKRNPEKEVYDLIITDLKQAITLLPEPGTIAKTQHVTATKYAAKSLLCNAYLERAYKPYAVNTDFSMAAQEAADVINSGKYTLIPGAKYGEIFVKEYSSESIFEVDYDYTISAVNAFVNSYYPRSFNKVRAFGGGGLRVPSKKITEQFEPGDLRTSTNFQVVPTSDGGPFDKEFAGMPYINKYPGIVTGGTVRNSDSNFIMYRLSDVMLMRAEALAKMGASSVTDAIAIVNTVRNRSGLANTTATSATDVFKAIQKERLYELCFENKRWYDLVRTGLLLEMRPEFTPKNRIYYPIPQGQIDINKNLLPQNPTY